jgi:hypothetical protein
MENETATVATTTNEIPVPAGLPPFGLRVKAERLKEWLGYIRTLVSEARVTVSRDGLKVSTVDPSHVAMLVSTLHRSGFEDISASEPVTVGLDVHKLLSAVKPAPKGAVVELRFDGKRLTVESDGLTRTMSVVDPAGIVDPKVPTVAGTGQIRVDRGDLMATVRQAEEIADHLVLEMGFGEGPSHPQLTISAEGETDKVRRTLTPTDGGSWSGHPWKSLYPLDFFSAMLKCAKSAESVLLASGNDYPLRLEFVTGWADGTFLLAPRIDEDSYVPPREGTPTPADESPTGDTDDELAEVASEPADTVTDDSPEANQIPAPADDGDNDSPPRNERPAPDADGDHDSLPRPFIGGNPDGSVRKSPSDSFLHGGDEATGSA